MAKYYHRITSKTCIFGVGAFHPKFQRPLVSLSSNLRHQDIKEDLLAVSVDEKLKEGGTFPTETTRNQPI